MDFESKRESVEKSEKETRWQQIEQEVEIIKDAKEKGIDKGIKFATISLKANGFGTTGSCEGHLDRGFPWPWVDVECPLAGKLLNDGHYNELKEKARAESKGGVGMTETEKQEYRNLVSTQVKENEKEYKRLGSLLEEFYESESQEKEEGLTEARLKIEKGPWNQSRLQPEDVPGNIAPEESQKLWSEEEKEKKLVLYRQEMERFANFLKEKFFG